MSTVKERLHHGRVVATRRVRGIASPQTRPAVTEQPSPRGCLPSEDEQVITQPAGPAPTPRHTGIKAMVKDLGSDFKHLPSKENLFWAGVGGGLALAVHPADDNVNESMVNSDFAHNFFKLGEVPGELPTLLLPAAITVYAVGRAEGSSPRCRTWAWT